MTGGHRTAALTLAGMSVAAVLDAFMLADEALLSAWRLGITLPLGIALGALALLAIGQLLGNEWMEAIGDELMPMAATLPILLLLALPLLLATPAPPTTFFDGDLTPAREAWFAGSARQVRLGLCTACWLGTLLLIGRHGHRRWASALGLALTSISFLVASTDWVMLSQPLWWSKLLPFCLASSQLVAALAIAFILNLAQRETLEDPHHRSLASGLLALALLTLWVWYAQFLTAWNTNMPAEARWYASRMGGGAPLLWTAVGLNGIGILGLLVMRRRRLVLLAAAVLLLLAHVLHALWLLRPARLAPASPLDLGIGAAIGLLWLAWLVLAARIHDYRGGHADRRPARSSTSGSG